MTRKVRIGNAHGFWGDRLEAAVEMLTAEPDLDYLTLDFLAEVSMSILALQRQSDPSAGFARDFVGILESITPYWRGGGKCRVITNAGGLNARACGEACQLALRRGGCADRTIAIVTGDDVLDLILADVSQGHAVDLSRNLDTGQTIDTVSDKLSTANAYLGAKGVTEALRLGADLVITGRVADPSLTVGACVQHFDWSWDDWDRLAGATVAGHLIECGTQVTGGILTNWLDVPGVARIGFPIVEVGDNGDCVVTKPRGSGGLVSPETVKEQLLYEIGDPDDYRSPDVTVSFSSIRVHEIGADQVAVRGAEGRPAPTTLKVSATWLAGYRASGLLTVFGEHAVLKAKRAAEAVIEQLRASGVALRQTRIDILGAGACLPTESEKILNADSWEVGLRIAVADESRAAVERFTRSLMPLITAGPPGTTGYSEGRPRVHPHFVFWPCLMQRDRVRTNVELLSCGAEVSVDSDGSDHSSKPGLSAHEDESCEPDLSFISDAMPNHRDNELTPSMETQASGLVLSGLVLGSIAHARSGDKGRHANIGIIARQPQFFDALLQEVTANRVARFLGISDIDRIERFELPHLGAVNFVIRNLLADSLCLDSQGKALGQLLLRMPIDTTAEELAHG